MMYVNYISIKLGEKPEEKPRRFCDSLSQIMSLLDSVYSSGSHLTTACNALQDLTPHYFSDLTLYSFPPCSHHSSHTGHVVVPQTYQAKSYLKAVGLIPAPCIISSLHKSHGSITSFRGDI
ncbi:hypothetical protein mRhiFer1_008731 [Rhinolophus ferrumequinum]|uniref:Uncharacterized protein n=1 Tax=Rhinolophus ferrumequinum TaxID=59479 RepID=A0A7J7TQC1_RHIFE|nr:hypothetical protein mRhiFer1_008731 [Rhinolophus ferrumequinum]